MKRRQPQNKQPSLQKHVHKHVKLCIVPSKENQYRPHLIRRAGLFVVAVLVVGMQLVYNVGETGSVLGEKANISMAALLDDTNSARRDGHLGELKLSQKLNQAAQMKADDMFAKQYWSHDAPDGTKPWKWFADAGYDYAEAGENLAKGFYTAEATTTAWMGSVEHRANILDPDYTDVGFAVKSGTLDDKPTTLVVALYGKPATFNAPLVTQAAVTTPKSESLGPVTRLGVAVQSVTPAAIGSLILLGFVVLIAAAAHLYRDHLPKARRHSHYRYHGVMKVGGALSLMLMVLYWYSGGQV